MLTVTFADEKTTLPLGYALRSKEILRGNEREVVCLVFDAAKVSFDQLNGLVSDEQRMAAFTTKSDAGTPEAPVATSTFENYIVRGEPVISLSRDVLEDSGNQQIDVFVVKMGQLTYIEQQLQKLGINPLG